jgi:acyl carrier protein
MTPELESLVAAVLDVPVEMVNDSQGPDDLPNWDSMGHFRLVTELEAQYGVAFSDEEVVGMLTVGQIRACLERHGATL